MNKKNIISLLVLAILAVAIPLGLNLARQQQTLKSSATEAPITFSGDNAEQRNGVWVVKDRTKPVTVTFTSPLGPPPVATGPAILRSVENPTKKKVSFSFPSLVKEVYADECSGSISFNNNCSSKALNVSWNVTDQGRGCNIYIRGGPPGGNNDEVISSSCSGSTPITSHKGPLNYDGIYQLWVSDNIGEGWTSCFNKQKGDTVNIGNTCGSQITVSTNCGNRTWGQIDSELRNAGYNGAYDHSSGELAAFNRTVSCGPAATSPPAATAPPSSSGGSNTYVDPGSGNTGQSFQVTATATSSCASGIGTNFGNGLTNCRGGCGDGGTTDGCKCDSNPKSDGKSCWWRWTCTGSTAGSYTASFNASGSSCSSSRGYTINASTVTATVDIKSNGSDSITIDHNASVNLTWTSSSNITSCTASGSWSGSKSANGNESTGALNGPSTKTYTLNCTGSGVTASDSVVVTVNAPPAQSCSITGDFNGDGSVTPADYNAWREAFVAGRSLCNVNADLVLFNVWKRKSQGL